MPKPEDHGFGPSGTTCGQCWWSLNQEIDGDPVAYCARWLLWTEPDHRACLVFQELDGREGMGAELRAVVEGVGAT